MTPKIIQITAVPSTKGDGYAIFGLSDKGKVFFWRIDTASWVLEKTV